MGDRRFIYRSFLRFERDSSLPRPPNVAQGRLTLHAVEEASASVRLLEPRFGPLPCPGAQSINNTYFGAYLQYTNMTYFGLFGLLPCELLSVLLGDQKETAP